MPFFELRGAVALLSVTVPRGLRFFGCFLLDLLDPSLCRGADRFDRRGALETGALETGALETEAILTALLERRRDGCSILAVLLGVAVGVQWWQ